MRTVTVTQTENSSPRGGGGGEHPALHRREPRDDVDQRHEHHDRDERELDQRRAALAGDQAQPGAQPAHAAISLTARPVTSTGSSAPSPASSVGTAPEQRTTTSVNPLASTSSAELHTSPSAVCG